MKTISNKYIDPQTLTAVLLIILYLFTYWSFKSRVVFFFFKKKKLFFSLPLKGSTKFIYGSESAVRYDDSEIRERHLICVFIFWPEFTAPVIDSSRSSVESVHLWPFVQLCFLSACRYASGRTGQAAHVCVRLKVWQKGPVLWTSA